MAKLSWDRDDRQRRRASHVFVDVLEPATYVVLASVLASRQEMVSDHLEVIEEAQNGRKHKNAA